MNNAVLSSSNTDKTFNAKSSVKVLPHNIAPKQISKADKSETKTTTPETGDSSPIILILIVLAFAALIVVYIKYLQHERDKHLSQTEDFDNKK